MSSPLDIEFEMLALFEMTPDLVCIAGKDGYFKKVNPAVMKTLQYGPEEIYSRPIFSFMHPDDHELTRRKRMDLLQGKPLVNFQNRYLTKGGDIVWLEWTSVYLPQKEIVFAIAKDISANKAREKAIAEKYNTYKHLADHFKNRAEEDRKYLAYELHEELAQLAASLKLQSDTIHQHLAGLSQDAATKIEEITAIADKLVRAIRRICFTVSPSMLEDLGFNVTMEWVCREYAALNGISCHYLSDCGDDELNKELTTDIFRVCQQALTCIAGQEGVTSLGIHLELVDDNIVVSITSDGKGVEKSQGLTHMHQLTLSMNASLTVANDNGKGTQISLRIKK